MKRTLILVRHGKSSWEEDLPDRERPLAERGLRDAPMMGKRLAKALADNEVHPDLILSSPACRALSTARLLADVLAYRGEIALDKRMYASDARTLLTVIGALDDGLRCVILVGHDPEFTELAHGFSSEITRMPTCAIARFSFEGEPWSAIPTLAPTRVWFDCPKKP
ncbi:SixA phosphatase family protein [Aeromonas lusitana]|uniref:Histidine phosphatase n=1 Tax=Aeromonas lusitana TaxID=931529 RepID=A0A2M8H7T3_9GAMM|nr:histidine phosphatase family protein [Aeromonas lusitana]PJC92633.1 histidine phosphatase [Aeromonas lusitana]